MSTNDRITRPYPDRIRPIRNWTALLGRSAPDGAPGDAPDSAAGGRGGTLGDAVSRSVELGYRVVDEYLKQGQRAAIRLQQGRAGAEHWAQDVQDVTLRMAQYASDFVATWAELLERAGSARIAPQTAPQPPEQRASQPGAPVRLNVVCGQPSEVSVELRGGAAGRRLLAHALRAAEPWKPRLEDVTIEHVGAATVVSVKVPRACPPGAYEGLILDEETSRPVGVVRVVIGTMPPA